MSWPSALAGVQSVLVTPFDEAGAVDLDGVRRLVRHVADAGVDGVVCFGLAGETYKLTDAERAAVLAAAVSEARGRVPVVAGVDHNSTAGAVARAVEAARLGAAGLMCFPPSFVPATPDEVVTHYAEVSERSGLPLIVQDAPAWTRVELTAPLLRRVREAVPGPLAVKVEAPPTSPKIRALTDAGLTVLGGFGALHLAEELAAGVVGVMPGCALSGLYVQIWAHVRRGDLAAARALWAAAAPLLVLQMGSLDVFVGVQKLLLQRAGVIAGAGLRAPGRALDADQIGYLDQVLAAEPLTRWVKEMQQ